MTAPIAPPPTPRSGRLTRVLGLLAAALALGWFAFRLDAEPRFVDESAFISQSYFWDLFLSGRGDDPRWLEYAAYDLPPLPKYLIGMSLQLGGLPRPDWRWAHAWYGDTSTARFVTPPILQAARLPSVALGVAGVLAVFAIGTMGFDRRVGFVAALLLAINPLYRLLARRAMADIPAESLVLIASALGMALWLRGRDERTSTIRVWLGVALTGLVSGLAVLAKLNGGLALMTLGAWALLEVALPSISLRGKVRGLAALAIMGALSAGTFVALNPFLTARPATMGGVPLMDPVPPRQPLSTRLAKVIQHRVGVSRTGQDLFPHDALISPSAKALALFVQGFGRFGPFGPAHSDSTKRFDPSQDWGVVLWFPLVMTGLAWTILRGWSLARRGEVSAPWLVATQFLVATATVGAFLPLAWDRYFLPIQATSGLMASAAMVGLYDAIRARVARS